MRVDAFVDLIGGTVCALSLRRKHLVGALPFSSSLSLPLPNAFTLHFIPDRVEVLVECSVVVLGLKDEEGKEEDGNEGGGKEEEGNLARGEETDLLVS